MFSTKRDSSKIKKIENLIQDDHLLDQDLNLLTAPRKGVQPNRVIIVDPSLKDYQGHHAEYDLAVARGLLGHGIKSIILCHQASQIKGDRSKRLVPVFSKTMWEFGVRQPTMGSSFTKGLFFPVIILLKTIKIFKSITPEIIWNPSLWKHLVPKCMKNNWVRGEDLKWAESPLISAIVGLLTSLPGKRFQRETLSAFKKIGLQKNDQVFFHMVIGPIFFQTLIASYWAFKRTSMPPVVLFRYPPSFFKFRSFNEKLTWKCAENLSEKGYLRLASDSHRLIREFADYSYAPFEMFPIPHGRTIRNVDGPRPQKIKIGYLGDARSEKGFNELVQVIREHTSKKSKLHFCLQIYNPDPQCLMSVAAIKQMAQNSESIDLYETALSSPDYLKLLRSLDVVVALYDPQIYQSRTSGICLDAWAAGKRVIATTNTWAQDWAEAMGLPGEFCRNQSVQELKNALEKIVMVKKNTKASGRLKAFHSSKSFADHLLGRKVSSLVASKALIFYPWEDYRKPTTGAGWVNKIFADAFRKKYKNISFVSDGPGTEENWQMKKGFLSCSLLKRAITLVNSTKNPEREILVRFQTKLTRAEKTYLNKTLTQAAACIIHYPFMLKCLTPWLKIKPLKTLTVHHDLLYKKAKTPKNRRLFLEKTKEACELSDKNTFISKEELHEFRKEVRPSLRNLETAPIASRILEELRASENDLPICQTSIKEQPFCVFFGSDAPENRDALAFFQIALERSRSAGLNLDFRVLGGVAKTAKKYYPELDARISLADEEFRQMIKESAFCYFPIIAGTGISIKTIEAIALGKVVLGSLLAFRGIEKQFLKNTFKIDNPAEPPIKIFIKILESRSRDLNQKPEHEHSCACA